MKKILLTLALVLISPLYADTTKRQEIQEYIKEAKNILNRLKWEADGIMNDDPSRYSIIPHQKKNEIAEGIEKKIKEHPGYKAAVKEITNYENKLQNASDTQLYKLKSELESFNRNTIERFAKSSKNDIKNVLDILLRKEYCPKETLTNQQWTSLKRNGRAKLTINGQIIEFEVMEEDKNNFPNMVQVKTWHDLMASTPEAITDKKLLPNDNSFVCQYKYRSSMTEKDYTINIATKGK